MILKDIYVMQLSNLVDKLSENGLNQCALQAATIHCIIAIISCIQFSKILNKY